MKKTKITIEEVQHIAKLAKLPLGEREIKQFQKQLSDIVDFVDQLSKMDTKNVAPTSQVTGLSNIFREDQVEFSLTQEEVLANAPRKYKGYFMVKAIL